MKFKGIRRVLASYDRGIFGDKGLLAALDACERFPGNNGQVAILLGEIAENPPIQ